MRAVAYLALLLPAGAFVPSAHQTAVVTRREVTTQRGNVQSRLRCRAVSLSVSTDLLGVFLEARAAVARAEEAARAATAARLTEEARAMQQAQVVVLLASVSEMEAGELRLADHARLVEEAQAGEARAAEALTEARAEEVQAAEGARVAEAARVAEGARVAAEARVVEAARVAEEARVAEAARVAEKARVAEEARVAEAARVAKEARAAKVARVAAAALERQKLSDASELRQKRRGAPRHRQSAAWIVPQLAALQAAWDPRLPRLPVWSAPRTPEELPRPYPAQWSPRSARSAYLSTRCRLTVAVRLRQRT